jgi:hypothetical protein
LFAPVAAIVSIDMTVGQRLRRAIESTGRAAIGLVIDAVFARSSVRDLAVAVTGTRALAKPTEGGARR